MVKKGKPVVKKALIGRSAKTGEFMTVAKARAQKSTAIVQRIPKPGPAKKK